MGHENDQQLDHTSPESLNRSVGTSKRSGGGEHHLDKFRRLLGASKTVAQAKPEENNHSKALQSPLFQPYERLLGSIAFGVNGDRIVKGASAPYVAALQMALQQLFPSFQPATYGTHDSESVSVTEQFQSKEGLTVDGEIGQNTLLALDSYGFSRINEQGQTERVQGHELVAELNQPAKITATAQELDIATRKTSHTHNDRGSDKGMHHGTTIDGIRVYSGPDPSSKLKFTVEYNQDVTLVGVYKHHSSWSLIQTQDGQEGWIDSSRVTTVSNAVQAMGAVGLVDMHMVGGAKDGDETSEQPLQNLGTIVQQHYGSTFVAEHDARLIIGAIAQLNEGRMAIYFKDQPHQLSWWERWLLDEQGEAARQTYQDIQVRDGHNLVLPKKSLLEQMKASGAINSGSIQEQYQGLIDGIKMYGGYMVGVPEGLWKGLVETLKAIPELLKLLWNTLKAAINGTLLEHLTQLWDGIVQFITNLPASADKWWQEFLKKSPFEQGREIGKGVGMIAFEVLVAIFTGAAGNALKAAGVTGRIVAKGSQIASKLKGIGGKVGTGLTKLGDKVGDAARPIINDLKDVVDPLPEAVTTTGHRVPMRRNDLPEFQQKGGDRMHMEGDKDGGGGKGPEKVRSPIPKSVKNKVKDLDNLHDWVDNLDDALLQKLDKLSTDALRMLDDDLPSIKNYLQSHPDQLENWSTLQRLHSNVNTDGMRRSDIFLKEFNDVINNRYLNDHLFEGHLKINGPNSEGGYKYNISGIHSDEAMSAGTVRVKPGTTESPLGDDYYKAKVEKLVEDQRNPGTYMWKTKKNQSTFFPKSWSRERIQMEVTHAFQNKVNIAGNKYVGQTTGGVDIHIYLETNGSIRSAFPVK